MISNEMYKELLIKFKEFYQERTAHHANYRERNNFLCYHLADFVSQEFNNRYIFDFAKKLHDQIFDDIEVNGMRSVILDGWVYINVPYPEGIELSHQTHGRLVYLQQLIDKCVS